MIRAKSLFLNKNLNNDQIATLAVRNLIRVWYEKCLRPFATDNDKILLELYFLLT